MQRRWDEIAYHDAREVVETDRSEGPSKYSTRDAEDERCESQKSFLFKMQQADRASMGGDVALLFLSSRRQHPVGPGGGQDVDGRVCDQQSARI